MTTHLMCVFTLTTGWPGGHGQVPTPPDAHQDDRLDLERGRGEQRRAQSGQTRARPHHLRSDVTGCGQLRGHGHVRGGRSGGQECRWSRRHTVVLYRRPGFYTLRWVTFDKCCCFVVVIFFATGVCGCSSCFTRAVRVAMETMLSYVCVPWQ